MDLESEINDDDDDEISRPNFALFISKNYSGAGRNCWVGLWSGAYDRTAGIHLTGGRYVV